MAEEVKAPRGRTRAAGRPLEAAAAVAAKPIASLWDLENELAPLKARPGADGERRPGANATASWTRTCARGPRRRRGRADASAAPLPASWAATASNAADNGGTGSRDGARVPADGEHGPADGRREAVAVARDLSRNELVVLLTDGEDVGAAWHLLVHCRRWMSLPPFVKGITPVLSCAPDPSSSVIG